MKKINAEQWMSMSAVVTAVVAVVIAVFELHTTREYQKLSVEPYLMQHHSNNGGYQFSISNEGLGPARIGSVTVRANGKVMSHWHQVVGAITGDKRSSMSAGSVSVGEQVRAAATVPLLLLTDLDTAKSFHDNHQKLDVEICYCSIYKDCWIASRDIVHQPVDVCPTTGQAIFSD